MSLHVMNLVRVMCTKHNTDLYRKKKTLNNVGTLTHGPPGSVYYNFVLSGELWSCPDQNPDCKPDQHWRVVK